MNNKRYKKRPKQLVDDNYIPPFNAGEMNVPIETLNLNEITYNLIKGANYNNILDLLKKTEKDFYKITKFNKKNLLEVINKLKIKGFYLKPLPILEEKESATEIKKENSTAVEKSNFSNKEKLPKPTVVKVNNPVLENNLNKNNSNNKRQRDTNGNNSRSKPIDKKDYRNEERRDDRREEKKPDYRIKTLESLNLSTITLKLMKTAGYKTIEDVLCKTESEIMKIKGFKKKDLFQLLEKLDLMGLALKGQEIEVKRKRPLKEIVKDEPDIYVKINKNGKWGFQDRSGKLVVPAIYDEVYSYKDEMCCVEKDEKYGFINRVGEEVVPIEYDCACSFSEGYAFVFKKDKGGYIDKENNNLTDFVYDAGTVVVDRNCRVKKDGKWGELIIDNPTEIRWII